MEWRFWKRGRTKDALRPAAENASAAPAWPANAGAIEILGLQQMVGNQTVLRMLLKNANAGNAKNQGH